MVDIRVKLKAFKDTNIEDIRELERTIDNKLREMANRTEYTGYESTWKGQKRGSITRFRTTPKRTQRRRR